MGKVIFWLVVFFLVLLALRLINVANTRSRNTKAHRGQRPPADGAMIRCVGCGVYLPSADARQGPRGPLCGDPQCMQRHRSGSE